MVSRLGSGVMFQFGQPADGGGVLDLQTLALSLWQGFVVSDLKNDIGNLLPEQLDQFGLGGLGIFKSVMQDGRNQHAIILDKGLIGEDIRQRDRVIDVRGSMNVLAALIAVPVGGEVDGLDEFVHGSLRAIVQVNGCCGHGV